MKALEILKRICNHGSATVIEIKEAIAELEALENRSCENCKYDYVDIDDNCERCNRYHDDKFELKASK